MIQLRKLISLALCLTASFTYMSAAIPSTEKLLQQLDADVANRTAFIQKREKEIDNLKLLLPRSPVSARFEVCDEICQRYTLSAICP